MKKSWIALTCTLPLALALTSCTSTAGSADGPSAGASAGVSGSAPADNGVIATAAPTAGGNDSPAMAAPTASTPGVSSPAGSAPASGSASTSIEASVAAEPGGGAAGSYGYIVRLTNRSSEPATLMAPFVVTLHNSVDANLSNALPLDFTHGAPSTTLQPGQSAEATLIVRNADVVARCKARPASFINIDSVTGTLKAPVDTLNIQGCYGGIGDVLSAGQ